MANVLDEDGNVVRTVDIGSKTAGEYEFVWDGKDSDGDVMEDGVYTETILTQDADGNAGLADTQIQEGHGRRELQRHYYLRVGGRLVAFTNITEVVNSDSSSSDDEVNKPIGERFGGGHERRCAMDESSMWAGVTGLLPMVRGWALSAKTSQREHHGL